MDHDWGTCLYHPPLQWATQGEGEGVRDRQSIRQKIILLPSIRTKMGKPLIHFRN